MKIKTDKKYLTVPVNTNAALKTLKFYFADDNDGKLILDLNVRIDMISPNFTAYIDISRFAGKELEIKCDPEMNFDVGATDVLAPDFENDPYRPKIHFTVKNGWNNDPNGLIKHNGIYHLFYQYNPCCSDWGNMHWGHAVSRDLIKWDELDTALFPDENGTVYSGCAFEDKKRVSGLGEPSGEAPVLLYYTAANNNLLSRGKKTSQCLAVMQNGVIQKHPQNPIIGHIEAENRDPKVVYVDEIGKYVMALYLNENRYLLLSSSDLVNWEEYQTLAIPHDSECPDIFPLECDGEKMWVIAGASDYYMVGRFENGKFTSAGSTKRLSVAGINYAAQSFSGIDDGRTVRIYWQRTRIPSARFTQQMSVPVEMSLSKKDGEYYLSALPVREIDAGREEIASILHVGSNPKAVISLPTAPIDIVLKAAFAKSSALEMTIFGSKLTLDAANNALEFGRTKIPLRVSDGELDVRIIVDRCSIEVYADGGRILFSDTLVCDYNLPFISVSASKEFIPNEFKVYELRV